MRSKIPHDKPSIIHVGLESHDGAIVEDERFLKIIDTVFWWDSKGKDLKWIYCHIFDPQVPPDGNWDFGETVLPFSKQDILVIHVTLRKLLITLSRLFGTVNPLY